MENKQKQSKIKVKNRLKKKTKPIEDKPKNQTEATKIFNEVISKRRELMNELYNSVDYNNLILSM